MEMVEENEDEDKIIFDHDQILSRIKSFVLNYVHCVIIYYYQ